MLLVTVLECLVIFFQGAELLAVLHLAFTMRFSLFIKLFLQHIQLLHELLVGGFAVIDLLFVRVVSFLQLALGIVFLPPLDFFLLLK